MDAKADIMHFIVLVVCFAVLLAIVYNFTRANSGVEHELKHIEELNSAIASESKQLQTDIAAHDGRIKRVHGVSEKIAKSSTDVERAVAIIEDCETIIESVKTKRQH